ncbi:MAG: ThiF family adenylyltransferase [Motiliproteus sp.]
MLDYDMMARHLESSGYSVTARTYDGVPAIVINHSVGSHQVVLIHFEVSQFKRLPVFVLDNSASYGQLAHLLTVPDKTYGSLCVSETDALSVNYEQPHLAIEASLARHLDILSKAILDPEWNKAELLREFQANWSFVCAHGDQELVVAAEEGSSETIEIFKPVDGAKFGLDSKLLGITESAHKLSDFSYIKWSQRRSNRKVCNASGYVLSVNELPLPPTSQSSVKAWYLSLINTLPDTARSQFIQRAGSFRSTEFWLVVNGPSPSGTVWFSLCLSSSKKRSLPFSADKLEPWSVDAREVVLFNPALLMPRSGADTGLLDKKVLLVGCGSVGSEIAVKLASAGVGNLTLLDPDDFELENLYRNALDISWVGLSKALALNYQIGSNYPWITVKGYTGRLLDSRTLQRELLTSFDLIVIAIGSPTQERLFQDHLLSHNIKTPVINTWVEGYGVGGHASLDIPTSQGCLRCAYVDNAALTRGLSSNLNFLEDDQSLTVNHAGCGQLFLPYSGINSAQTAIMASDLAVKYLRGLITESSQVSWKGPSADAEEKGFQLTHRYYCFEQSLEIVPLFNEYCDVCCS